MAEPSRREIKVEALARVEGEGAMTVRMEGDHVTDVELRIYEPPRFFEAFLRDRHFTEAPDITARICGICPIAYQMSSVHAMEDACGVSIDGPIRELRRLLYCGEWIESHTLHVYMLHAPDFLGYESAIHLAEDAPEAVKRGLELKKTGNELVTVLGGREIHPVNVRVGGFYRAPTKTELQALVPKLEKAREAAAETIRWVAGFDFPDYERDYVFVSVQHPDEYPFNEGRIVASTGLDIDVHDYPDHFAEHQSPHSTALHSTLKGVGSYFVGPMARWALNRDRLPATVLAVADEVGLEPVCKNPFRSIIVRSVEVLFAVEEALRIIDAYEQPDRPHVEVRPTETVTGHGCTEAPRGLLYHRYEIDAEGLIRKATIIPPTSQNQGIIEKDLKEVAQKHIELPNDKLSWRCEQSIRNYDPCISCATHFLDLTVERE